MSDASLSADRAGLTPTPEAVVHTAEEQAQAERVLERSLFISGVRCTLTYVLIPYLFPLVGWGAGAGPWLGLPIGLAAIVANVFSIRRLHRADHRLKWPMTALSVGIICLLVVLVVSDAAELLG